MVNLTFSHPLTVQPKDIDSLGHVNNEVYLRWLLQAAEAHSASLGYTMESFLSSGQCFVVRRHELDYLLPAFLGEELVIETWIKDLGAAKSTRVYRLKRLSDGKVLMNAQTLWVYVDLKSGRPTEIPPSMAQNYGRYLHRAE